MRIVRTIADCQRALNELFDFFDKAKSKALDMAGQRITNGSKSQGPNDFVIQSELKSHIEQGGVIRTESTLIFSKEVPTDDDTSPPYFVGIEREGSFVEVWLSCIEGPSGGDLSIQVYIDYED